MTLVVVAVTNGASQQAVSDALLAADVHPFVTYSADVNEIGEIEHPAQLETVREMMGEEDDD